VDWWFIYKAPNGLKYAYYDSQSSATSLSLNSNTLDDPHSALGQTLGQMYSSKHTAARVLYNDEPAGSLQGSSGSGVSGGHTKGLFVADSHGGFWLIHSVPVFPDATASSYTWKSASTIYGQTFLCVTLTTSGIEAAAAQMQYADPFIYDSSVDSSFARIYPTLTALFQGTRQKGSNVAPITSAGGVKFTSFAKDNQWGQDLYDDLVEPTLQTPMEWETWRRSPYLNSLCASTKSSGVKYDVLNVESITIGSDKWLYTQDHSKWGCSSRPSWVCVGGINRMPSQRSRGGDTLCTSAVRSFWTALSATVSSADQCTSKGVQKVKLSPGGGASLGRPGSRSGAGPSIPGGWRGGPSNDREITDQPPTVPQRDPRHHKNHHNKSPPPQKQHNKSKPHKSSKSHH